VCLGLRERCRRPTAPLSVSPSAARSRSAARCIQERLCAQELFLSRSAKGYQISQFDQPLATHGTLSFLSPERGVVPATIVRLHIEEDAGKSIHDRFPKATAVDLNRAGVPLVEIVAAPISALRRRRAHTSRP